MDACQTSWVHILNNSLQTFCTNEAVVHLSFRHQKAAIKTHPAIGNFNSNYWLLRVHKRRNWKKKEPRRTILLFCLFIFLLKAFKTNERSNVAFDWLLTKIYWKANLIRGFQVEYNLTSNVSCCCFSSRKWPLLSVTSKKSPKVHKSCPKNIFYKINERFWHLYKNCQKCGRFGQNNSCHQLLKVAQKCNKSPNLVTLEAIDVAMHFCSCENVVTSLKLLVLRSHFVLKNIFLHGQTQPYAKVYNNVGK